MREASKLVAWILIVGYLKCAWCYEEKVFNLFMPNVRPNVPELYLCTPVKINASQNYYITGFEPNTIKGVAHHILLYGCSTPGTGKEVWNCGEMAHNTDQEEISPPCSSGAEIIYAWARNATGLLLPQDVGFKVGGNSDIQYLVLQVHYAHVNHLKPGETDNSGVILHYTTRPTTKLAGVFLLGTAGIIPPHSTEYLESACELKENKTLHPLGYRVHTHELGKVVSGYVIKKGYKWIELGKKDPLAPQMFYEVDNHETIEMGDTLAARCTMVSNRNKLTHIGSTNADEMCNFYLMYYVENDTPLKMQYCFTPGSPLYHWKAAGLKNIPNREASTL